MALHGLNFGIWRENYEFRQPKVDNWAFNLPRGQQLLDKWNQIPAGVDVLLTHTPPLGELYSN